MEALTVLETYIKGTSSLSHRFNEREINKEERLRRNQVRAIKVALPKKKDAEMRASRTEKREGGSQASGRDKDKKNQSKQTWGQKKNKWGVRGC